MNRYRKPRTVCFFCSSKIETIDFKDVKNISRFITARGKILGRTRSGVCARHQRALSRAIKLARQTALMPYTDRHSLVTGAI